MGVTIWGAARFAFWFFCAFQVAVQIIWVFSEWWIKWDNLVDKSQANQNFCDDICAISRASKRYGDNVRQCSEICRPSYQLPIVAARATLENYHPCGLNTPCLQALFDFISSASGALTVVLAIFVLPGIIRQIMCPIPSVGLASSSSPQRHIRRREPLSIHVDEILVDEDEDDGRRPMAAITGSPTTSTRSGGFLSAIGWTDNKEKVHHL
jgi:hypothetical protein